MTNIALEILIQESIKKIKIKKNLSYFSAEHGIVNITCKLQNQDIYTSIK